MQIQFMVDDDRKTIIFETMENISKSSAKQKIKRVRNWFIALGLFIEQE